MALINTNNLNERSLTNGEVIDLLSKLSWKVDSSGYSRVLDVIEELTNNRNFNETKEMEECAKQIQKY